MPEPPHVSRQPCAISFCGHDVKHVSIQVFSIRFIFGLSCQIGTMPIDPNAKPCQVTILGARVLEVENNLAAERSDLQTRPAFHLGQPWLVFVQMQAGTKRSRDSPNSLRT